MTPTISQSMPVTYSERTDEHLQSIPLARRHVIARPKRFAPLAASAALALLARGHRRRAPRAAREADREAFTQAWERGDHRAMYALLSDAARRRTTFERLQRTYQQAADTLTLERVRAGEVESERRPDHARHPHLRPVARRPGPPDR